MRTPIILGASLMLTGAVSGCGGGSPVAAGGSGGQTTTTTAAPIVWGPCPADTAYTSEPGVDCAAVDLPLDHAAPDGETISIFVARRRSGISPAPQLWLLDGGPGSSGEDFFWGLTDTFAAAMPDVDIYVPAHRGSGRSAGLVCSGEAHGTPNDVELSPAEWTACIAELTAKWGPKLAAFNVTNAAHDVGTLIERLHNPSEKVFVYGLSYGTYLGLRYLELYPQQPNGVILDSMVAPGSTFISQADAYFDPVAQKYAGLCQADATCSARLGPDPWAKVQSIVTAVRGGHCAEAGFTPDTLRYALGATMMGWYSRLMGLALLYRLDRCAPEDVTAIETFKTLFFSPYDLDGFSHGLESNISFSELWESPAPTPAELKARNDATLFSLNWGAERADVYGAWPKYAPDAHQLAWPDTPVPVLVLNGTLDTETPFELAQLAEQALAGPRHTFVALPNSPHGGGYQSPSTVPGSNPCGVDIMASFVRHPGGPPDTSCIATMKPLVFEDTKRAKVFFGTAGVWDNDPAPPAPPPHPHPRAPRLGRGPATPLD